MDTPTQSSFIPQDAASFSGSGGSRTRSQGGLSDLILLMTIVLFVASLALAGSVFLYEEYLKTSAASKVDQLQRAKDAFEPSLIHTLTRLDDRMHVADELLSAHLAPTAFFTILQEATLTTIQFKSLDLDAADPQRIQIKMSGTAQSVNSIALQADLFSKNGTITNPIFSDINRQGDGVHFALTALVNPQSVNFVRLVNGSNNAQAPATDPSLAPQQTQQPDPFGGPATAPATTPAPSTPAPVKPTPTKPAQ